MADLLSLRRDMLASAVSSAKRVYLADGEWSLWADGWLALSVDGFLGDIRQVKAARLAVRDVRARADMNASRTASRSALYAARAALYAARADQVSMRVEGDVASARALALYARLELSAVQDASRAIAAAASCTVEVFVRKYQSARVELELARRDD